MTIPDNHIHRQLRLGKDSRWEFKQIEFKGNTPTSSRRAVGRFLESQGKTLLIVGVLIRDTRPNAADLQGRGKALALTLPAPTRVQLFAWYLPVPIADWPALLREGRHDN